MKIHYMVLIVLCGFHALGAEKEDFCAQARKPDYGITRSLDSSQHMGFRNHGGLLNSGVCWWHSLLQRSALYLARFRPELAKPTARQVRYLLRALQWGDRVVEIPGFADFNSFSTAWASEVQKILEEWQISDGFLLQKWIGNIGSLPALPPNLLRLEMERIYQDVMESRHLAWVMVKFPGFPAHAWLISHIDRDQSGMTLWILDSNHPGRLVSERYNYGSSFVRTRDFGPGLPYLRRQFQHYFFQWAISSYCN